MSGWVAAHRQVIVNSEAALDFGDRARADAYLDRALSVPLVARESFVGTMTLYAKVPFTEDQSRLAQVIAPHLAQAIWTSRRNDRAAQAIAASRQSSAPARMRLISNR